MYPQYGCGYNTMQLECLWKCRRRSVLGVLGVWEVLGVLHGVLGVWEVLGALHGVLGVWEVLGVLHGVLESSRASGYGWTGKGAERQNPWRYLSGMLSADNVSLTVTLSTWMGYGR